MNEKLPPFLRKEKDSILFNGDGELYFYVPEKYFDLKIRGLQSAVVFSYF